MLIGLLHEGYFDDFPCRAIINRIVTTVTPFTLEQIKYRPYPARGPILKKMEAAAITFFDDEVPTDIAIFMSDVDDDHNRKKEIPEWVRKYNTTKPKNIIVIGLPEPTFEHWLLQEANAVKNLLSIPGENPIYSPQIKPKIQLAELHEKYNRDPTFILKDLYVEAAQQVDLDFLSSNDKSFEKFYTDLKAALRTL